MTKKKALKKKTQAESNIKNKAIDVNSITDSQEILKLEAQLKTEFELEPEKAAAVANMVSRSIIVSRQFSGPLPSPESLAEFESIQVGFADRIVSMAEKSQLHRHNWENITLESEVHNAKIGMYGGIGVSVLLILAAAFSAYIKQPVVAGMFLGTAALGMVKTLVDGRSKKPENKSSE